MDDEGSYRGRGCCPKPATFSCLPPTRFIDVLDGSGTHGLDGLRVRRSQSLDPRNAATARVLSNLLLWLRRYDEARAMSDQALALSPSALNGV